MIYKKKYLWSAKRNIYDLPREVFMSGKIYGQPREVFIPEKLWLVKRSIFGLCKEMEVRDERVVSDDFK